MRREELAGLIAVALERSTANYPVRKCAPDPHSCDAAARASHTHLSGLVKVGLNNAPILGAARRSLNSD